MVCLKHSARPPHGLRSRSRLRPPPESATCRLTPSPAPSGPCTAAPGRRHLQQEQTKQQLQQFPTSASLGSRIPSTRKEGVLLVICTCTCVMMQFSDTLNHIKGYDSEMNLDRSSRQPGHPLPLPASSGRRTGAQLELVANSCPAQAEGVVRRAQAQHSLCRGPVHQHERVLEWRWQGRRSGFRSCAVKTSNKPTPLDALEPLKSHGSHKLEGRLCVLTNVDRDDLPDGESHHSAQTVRALKVFQELNPRILVDCLTSYFRGDMEAVSSIANSGLDVYAHNIETVEVQPSLSVKNQDMCSFAAVSFFPSRKQAFLLSCRM